MDKTSATRCECTICQNGRRIQTIANQLPEHDRKWLLDFYDAHLAMGLDLEVDEAILNGSWPSALEQLESALAKARTQRSIPAEVFDLVAHIKHQIEFSSKTFGPGGRTRGVVDHIRKELAEIEKKPEDLEEWIDVIILGIDGAWRAGHSAEDIVRTLIAKQLKNEARKWPDWRTADRSKAIEHIRKP